MSYIANSKRHIGDAKKSLRYDLLFYVAVTVVVILLLQFVARFAVVSGSSMEPSLHNGDVVLIREFNYIPMQGDIVITNKNSPLGLRIAKRVIAVEGQRVEIKNSCVWVNGILLDEPYVSEEWGGDDYIGLTVPDGQVFLMGDNRNASVDSRQIGCVSESALMGKVIYRIFNIGSR